MEKKSNEKGKERKVILDRYFKLSVPGKLLKKI
jgi:hypothetical protein